MRKSKLNHVYKTLTKMLVEVKMKKTYSAFTLAEVLITLGVIGVVAAMTLPTVFADIKATRFKTQFKKTLSVVNQGVRMAQAKWGLDFTLQGFSSTSKMTSGPSSFNLDPDIEISQYAIFSSTMKGEWNKSYCYPTSSSPGFCKGYYDENLRSYAVSGMYAFQFLDGSEIYVSNCMPYLTVDYYGGKGCTKDNTDIACYGWIDVNGYKNGPNKEVKCSDGTKKLVTESGYADCTVDSKSLTDIYPVWFHDGMVEALTNASRAALGAK